MGPAGVDRSSEPPARARILQAAVRRYAADGLDAPLRSIAADAGVSAALIVHHFGSRDGLHRACDEHTLTVIRDSKSAVLGGGSQASSGMLLTQLAQVEGHAPAVGYVLRRLQQGGRGMTEFVEHVVADAVAYLEEGVRAGTVRPSRFPEARARLLTEQSLGALLLHLSRLGPRLDPDELPARLRDYTEQVVGPALELYTEALLTERVMLDTYLDQRSGRTP